MLPLPWKSRLINGCIDDDEKIIFCSKNILKWVRNEEDIYAESALLTYVRIRCWCLNLIWFYRQEWILHKLRTCNLLIATTEIHINLYIHTCYFLFFGVAGIMYPLWPESCWIEEVEILKQEFCRYISACKKMEQVWMMIHAQESLCQSWHTLQINNSVVEQYQLCEALVTKPTSEYRVYAAQKASMY